MKKLLCWIFGHNFICVYAVLWNTSQSDSFKGELTFNEFKCMRCGSHADATHIGERYIK